MTSKTPKKQHTKALFSLVIGLVALTAAVFYFGVFSHGPAVTPQNIKIDGVFLPTGQEITQFNLTDNHGKPFTKSDFLGHWTMVFFGFTNCGYICPTTMAELNKMYRQLQEVLPDKQLPLVVMVSVDAERDTVDKMNSYIQAFNPHFVGVIGSEQEIISLEKQLHIVSAKMQADGQGKDHYTINHSAELIVFNPKGQVQAFMSYPHQAQQMIDDYRKILAIRF
jgi:protein SCO1/2